MVSSLLSLPTLSRPGERGTAPGVIKSWMVLLQPLGSSDGSRFSLSVGHTGESGREKCTKQRKQC